ncbi:nuclear transport factor 2 family protein [Allocoleopsis franciscana]|nr:nuclear transport factor 2 family protein [Allocoleopsis franciscana]
MHSSQTDTLLVDPKIQQLVERQAQAWETADSKQIIADFTDDCLFAVPGSRFRGKQEVKDAADSYFAEFMETKVTIKRIITNGNEGAIEWIWSEKNKETGEKTQAEDAIIFELEGGKIKYWREYIDKKSIS